MDVKGNQISTSSKSNFLTLSLESLVNMLHKYEEKSLYFYADQT